MVKVDAPRVVKGAVRKGYRVAMNLKLDEYPGAIRVRP